MGQEVPTYETLMPTDIKYFATGLGTPGTYAPVAVSTNVDSGIMDVSSQSDVQILVSLKWAGSLTTGTTVKYYWSIDKTNWFLHSTVVGSTGANRNPTNLTLYSPPPGAKFLKVNVANGDNAVAISSYVVAIGVQRGGR